MLLGEDSGAQLAALLAAERPAGVIGAVLIGGFYDLAAIPALSRNTRSRASSRARRPSRSVVPQMPPLLVVHGGADGEAPTEHARRYCRQIVASAEDDAELVEVAGASHRSENWWPSQWSYKREMVEWLSALARGRAFAHRPP